MKFKSSPPVLYPNTNPSATQLTGSKVFMQTVGQSPRQRHRSSPRTQWPFKRTSVAAERSEVDAASERDSSHLCRSGTSFSSCPLAGTGDGWAADAQLMEGAEGRAVAIRPLTHVAPGHLCDCRPVSHTWLPVSCKQPFRFCGGLQLRTPSVDERGRAEPCLRLE